jgi:uncharacterized membrane protein YbaN (DUF454 family)
MHTARTPGLETLEGSPEAASPRRVSTWAFRSAGFALVGLGLLGIVVPLLPTTIFLLGAAACFARSSPAAHRWLHTNRLFGRYLRDYRERRGATVATKAVSIATLWLGLALSAYFIGFMPWVDVALVLVGLAVTWHLLRLKTLH